MLTIKILVFFQIEAEPYVIQPSDVKLFLTIYTFAISNVIQSDILLHQQVH